MASAASITISRILPFSSSTTTAAAALFPAKSRSLSISSFSSSFIRPLKSNRTSSISYSSASAPISAALSVGSKLPDATLSYLDSDGEVQTTTVSDLTKSKKAILFAVPGAFTPTCSQKHVPGFVEKSAELKAKGVDVIACISVNDVFVMKAWKENLKISDEVLLLSDGNLEFTKAIEAELDLSDKPVGLGVRSRRYSMLVDDGVVKVLNLEEGGAFTSSGAEDILKIQIGEKTHNGDPQLLPPRSCFNWTFMRPPSWVVGRRSYCCDAGYPGLKIYFRAFLDKPSFVDGKFEGRQCIWKFNETGIYLFHIHKYA